MSQLPRPLQFSNVVGVQTRCRSFIRQPESPAEQALVRVGWMMYGAVQSYGTTKVVTAMSGADGMCRPVGYQAFVYWEGRYAGTLAPSPMDSRTDGALTTIRLVSPTRILGEFARYNQSDPLCCPTRTSYVTYEVNRDDLPLVTPVSVNTWPAGTSSEGPDADNVPSDALFGKRWKLTEVDGAAVRTTKAYIEFDRETNRVTGDSGCNRITGGFELSGRTLRFSRLASTRRACTDTEDQRIESDLLQRLEQTTRYRIDGDTLRLQAVGAPILTFEPDTAETGSLFGSRWRLTEIDGAGVRTTKPYIEFDQQANRLTGDTGCNRISGGFEVDRMNLRLSRVISTRRACIQSEDQRVETDLLQRLEQTTRYRIEGNTLRLFADRTPILAFEADTTGTGGGPREGRVTGTVTYLQRIALPPDAVIEVKLLDVSRADVQAVTIAEDVIRPAGRQVPIEFELRYDPRRIDQRNRYSIQARILQGNQLRFVSTESYPVITGGSPNTVNVVVRPVPR